LLISVLILPKEWYNIHQEYNIKIIGEYMNFLETIKKNKEKMLADMQGLLRIDSTLVESDSPEAPFGEGIRASLDYVLALGEEMGLK
jgi:hypothetical protein